MQEMLRIVSLKQVKISHKTLRLFHCIVAKKKQKKVHISVSFRKRIQNQTNCAMDDLDLKNY